MIQFANAKINLGLQVVGKREDGYHNIETVFYPIPFYDVVETVRGEKTQLLVSGMEVPGNLDDNLCLRAYHQLAADFQLPPVRIYLHKTIPMGAGLGGGSSDAAAVLKLLNNQFGLGLDTTSLENYASRLGADCAFFIENKPVFAYGIGNEFKNVSINLKGYHLLLIDPGIPVSTQEAYQNIEVNKDALSLIDTIARPISEWKSSISNDFESGIFRLHPLLAEIKNELYQAGAIYASMSGSGSTLFGIFEKAPQESHLDYFVNNKELKLIQLLL